MDTKLTNAERLILANQFEILGHIHDDKANIRMASHLRDGHEYLYRDLLGTVSPEMEKDTTEFVLDTLSMYRAMNHSLIKLGIDADIKKEDVEWPGFDGNNEGNLYFFTRALSSDGRFDELLGDDGVNSHSPMTHVYQQMLPIWKALGDSRYQLTAAQIKEILAARGY
ncbi:YfbU family protein [Janthinobacterium sp. HSC-3S05]|uniref:YfbU family protein n=1 Tax=Janthinobacterium lividum TaxID=29581 RepID=UPI001CD9152B|nr:YfbU family protein [Janthinobacterium lividum]MCA1862907.1 YfbU family protein [Janthinobacterium lividum]